MKRSKALRKEKGFTLLETMIAGGVLVFGILSLSTIFTSGLQSSNNTQIEYIAQQKAQQALESIFTARDTHTLSWAAINNVSKAGVFLDGPQPMLAPGPDGLVGTKDDDTSNPDTIVVGPGADNILGTAANDHLTGAAGDDVVLGAAGNDTLRGLEGNDYVDGGAGNDQIGGDAGSDQLFGRAGNDPGFASRKTK